MRSFGQNVFFSRLSYKFVNKTFKFNYLIYFLIYDENFWKNKNICLVFYSKHTENNRNNF